MLQFTTSQQKNTTNPFQFKTAGIKVYSLEEALYHTYHHWRESVDDLLSDSMISWVAEIGHSYHASEMKKLTKKEPFAKKIIDFLRIIDYFSPKEIDALRKNLEAWELRREWEKLKERADHLVKRNEPAKAAALYKRALQYEENSAILNNLGVTYMQLFQSNDALKSMSRALTLDPDNLQILLHYTESAIMAQQYDLAEKSIEIVKDRAPDNADIPFLRGLMAHGRKNYATAIEFFNDAIQKDPTTTHYVYKAVDTHLAIRQYEKALEVLEQSAQKDTNYYTKEADIHENAADIPAAIRAVQQAIDNSTDSANASLLARLASLHRQNKDDANAEESIKKALELDPNNDIVQLENARIKKGLGRSKEYQTALNKVLKGFKEKYRAS